jgi:hypothetical protein
MRRQETESSGIMALARGAPADENQRWHILAGYVLREEALGDFLVSEVDALEPAAGGFEFKTRAQRDAARAKLKAEADEVRVEIERRAAEADRDAAAARLGALEGPNEAA